MRRRRWAAAVAPLALLVGCSAPGPTAELVGRTFVSSDVHGRELMDGTAVQISFRDDGLRASAGCNTMSGAMSVADSRLHLEDGLLITEMGCDPAELHEQDDWLVGLLSSEPVVDLDGGTLILETGAVTITLEQASEPGSGAG